MAYLIPSLVLAAFLVALLILFAVATHSVRRSWYLAMTFMGLAGLLATYVASWHAADSERLQRVLRGLAFPAGSPVTINPTTVLMEVKAQNSKLIYRYETADKTAIPTQMDAARQNCSVADIRAALELGAQVEHVYRSATIEVLRIIVLREDCL